MEVPIKKEPGNSNDGRHSDSLQGFLSQTLATLVLYNTSLDKSITFQKLTAALANAGLRMEILVYDNSAIKQAMPQSAWWGIHYVHDPSNPGVSKAYNEGFRIAKEKGKKWFLLLDQDTDYPSDFFESYFNSIHGSTQKLFVPKLYDSRGMVSPLTFQWGGGKRIKELAPGSYSTADYKFHNCGMLISADVVEKGGGFDEQFPLDFSDFSFIDRIKKFTSSFVVTPVTGYHQMASTSHASLHDRLTRFESYCRSCRLYKRHYQPGNLAIEFRLLLRSIKLSIQYRSFQFILLYSKTA